MRTLNKIGFIIFIVGALVSCGNKANKEAVKHQKKIVAEQPPNIVFILSDDQSWTDYSFMGDKNIETPRLDQFASESLTFTRGYVPTSLCSPSLATIITGLYPKDHGVLGNDVVYEKVKNTKESKKNRAEAYAPIITQFEMIHILYP